MERKVRKRIFKIKGDQTKSDLLFMTVNKPALAYRSEIRCGFRPGPSPELCFRLLLNLDLYVYAAGQIKFHKRIYCLCAR